MDLPVEESFMLQVRMELLFTFFIQLCDSYPDIWVETLQHNWHNVKKKYL